MGARTPIKKRPINCPYCDEPAYHKDFTNRLVMPNEIYDIKQCPMGHEFITVEYAPEDQDEVYEKFKKLRKLSKEARLGHDVD